MLRSDMVPMTPHSNDGARSRADLITDAIRQAVVEQRIAPGTRLSEDQIGLLFGASRTIVRSALQKLAHDGLVTLAKNRGASVAAPSVSDARHVFDARRGIEELLVRRAAQRITSQGERVLQDLITQGRQAMLASDRGPAIRLSGDYHLAIAAIADQPVLESFLTELVSRSSLVIALYGSGRSADCRATDHEDLLVAMRRGNGDVAAALMREHLAHIEADLDLTERVRPLVPLKDALMPGAAAAT